MNNIINIEKILKGLKTIENETKTYLGSVSYVESYFATMKKTPKPLRKDFYEVPSDYDIIEEIFDRISLTCSDFTTTIYSQLQNHPTNCENTLDQIGDQLADSKEITEAALANPNMTDSDIKTC